MTARNAIWYVAPIGVPLVVAWLAGAGSVVPFALIVLVAVPYLLFTPRTKPIWARALYCVAYPILGVILDSVADFLSGGSLTFEGTPFVTNGIVTAAGASTVYVAGFRIVVLVFIGEEILAFANRLLFSANGRR